MDNSRTIDIKGTQCFQIGFETQIPDDADKMYAIKRGTHSTSAKLVEVAGGAAPAESALMKGEAPVVADFAGADAAAIVTELNAFLVQLKARGVIA